MQRKTWLWRPYIRAAIALCSASWIALLPEDTVAALSKVDGRRDLEFGTAAGDADIAGTVVMDAADNKSVNGGAFDLGGADRSAEFKLTGQTGDPYNCTLPGQIQLNAGAGAVTVDSFITDQPLAGTLPAKNLTINVGATLQVPAGQSAGSYSGTLTMDCGALQDSVAATATLGAFISISNTGSLDFGKAAPTGTAGTVTITPAGGRSAINVDLFGGGTVGSAGFNVTGEPSQGYAITLPSSATLTGPSATMTVDSFIHDAGGTPTLSGGSDSFNVGATLHVGANQAAGTYSGTFAVTVSYN